MNSEMFHDFLLIFSPSEGILCFVNTQGLSFRRVFVMVLMPFCFCDFVFESRLLCQNCRCLLFDGVFLSIEHGCIPISVSFS